MISFIVVFTLGTVQAFYGSTGILRFITLYPGSFFLQQDGWLKKGVDFPNECQILEICNPQKAKEVLTDDMSMNMVLPCRISVYSEEGKTKIGMIKPKALLEVLSNSESLMKVAEEVEAITMEMIKEAK